MAREVRRLLQLQQREPYLLARAGARPARGGACLLHASHVESRLDAAVTLWLVVRVPVDCCRRRALGPDAARRRTRHAFCRFCPLMPPA